MARRLRIDQGSASISITRTSDDRPVVMSYRTGDWGTVGPAGTQTGVSVWWFGDSLRFDQRSSSRAADGSPLEFERNEVWSLTDEGLLTITITERRSQATASRSTGLYTKIRA
jgi:hypothetical protein